MLRCPGLRLSAISRMLLGDQGCGALFNPFLLCTAAVRTVNEPAMGEQLDRLGVRVVLKPFLIEDLLRAITGALTAQALIAEATHTMSSGRPDHLLDLREDVI